MKCHKKIHKNDAENFIIHVCIYSNNDESKRKHFDESKEGKLRFLSNFPRKLNLYWYL